MNNIKQAMDIIDTVTNSMDRGKSMNYTGSPEQLEVISEAIDWTDVYVTASIEPIVLGVPPECSMHEEYNPKENPAQLLEIIEKFKIDLMYNEINKVWEAEIPNTSTKEMPDIFQMGETIADAVLAAMWEVVK